MTIKTTYTHARANFVALWDRVTDDREIVVIERRGAEDVALIAADELAGLLETAYLLRSPRNAERLLAALAKAQRGEGTPMTLEELRAEVGLEEAE
jgi:antitoxin YefM